MGRSSNNKKSLNKTPSRAKIAAQVLSGKSLRPKSNPLPKMTKVKSSNIASIGYKKEKGKLFVKFKSGRIGYYDQVPESLYNDMISTKSPTKFQQNYLGSGYIWTSLDKK